MSHFTATSRPLAFATVFCCLSVLGTTSNLDAGAKPSEAFFVRCDRTTMTQNAAGEPEVIPKLEVGVREGAEVSPIDALLIINELGRHGAEPHTLQRHPIRFGGTGTAARGCDTNCAEIGQTCICLEGTGLCGCGTLSFAGFPVPVVDDGHRDWIVIESLLTDDQGNELARHVSEIFVGDEPDRASYNRSIANVELRTSNQDPRQTDVLVGVRVEAQAFGHGPLDLSFGVEIEYEDETGRTRTISPPPFIDVNGDDGAATATGCGRTCAELGKTCVCFVDLGLCGCGEIFAIISGLPPIPLPATTIDPERVVVRLVPPRGALPELPGFEDDDEASPEASDDEVVTDQNRPFRRGDANMSGGVDMGDQIFLLAYLFQGGPAPSCDDAADTNDDGSVDIGDPVAGLAWLFQGAAEPPFPGPYRCEEDPTRDRLGCAGYRVCGL